MATFMLQALLCNSDLLFLTFYIYDDYRLVSNCNALFLRTNTQKNQQKNIFKMTHDTKNQQKMFVVCSSPPVFFCWTADVLPIFTTVMKNATVVLINGTNTKEYT